MGGIQFRLNTGAYRAKSVCTLQLEGILFKISEIRNVVGASISQHIVQRVFPGNILCLFADHNRQFTLIQVMIPFKNRNFDCRARRHNSACRLQECDRIIRGSTPQHFRGASKIQANTQILCRLTGYKQCNAFDRILRSVKHRSVMIPQLTKRGYLKAAYNASIQYAVFYSFFIRKSDDLHRSAPFSQYVRYFAALFTAFMKRR